MDIINREIDTILENEIIILQNGEVSSYTYLCLIFDRTKYKDDWEEYWKLINTENYITMSCYFRYYPVQEELLLLRLLVVEDFKRYLVDRK